MSHCIGPTSGEKWFWLAIFYKFCVHINEDTSMFRSLLTVLCTTVYQLFTYTTDIQLIMLMVSTWHGLAWYGWGQQYQTTCACVVSWSQVLQYSVKCSVPHHASRIMHACIIWPCEGVSGSWQHVTNSNWNLFCRIFYCNSNNLIF